MFKLAHHLHSWHALITFVFDTNAYRREADCRIAPTLQEEITHSKAHNIFHQSVFLIHFIFHPLNIREA